ncbi:hypothetical protein L914_08822 [Phytophthora nicotianae]|uniref:Uncharacterized protein n=1 Tax=Phytophthora nicotianae TaxID=4792 RepID=W2NED9_PHYNI|nr:hypothetical protein L914_08822 [Phytophthora nicotianae]
MDSDSSEDEELALLTQVCGGRPRLKRFNFDQPATAPVWKSKFRYAKDDIQALIVHFCLPDPFPARQRYHVSAFETLSIFLRRMAYSRRQSMSRSPSLIG